LNKRQETAMSQPEPVNYRQIYHQILNHLSIDERVAMALGAVGDLLQAFCFDQNEQVIIAVISNQTFGLEQARLIAEHHHNGASLDHLTKTPNFISDSAVRSHLLKNRASTALVLKRIFLILDLFHLHNVASGQEATEQAKMQARDALRKKFDQSTPEQRVHFIINTEGRCLRFFYKMKMGPETADLLGKHEYTKFILVRNLLVFPGLPPQVLRGMSKSPVIWRNNEYRRRILGHTNCPMDVKQKR